MFLVKIKCTQTPERFSRIYGSVSKSVKKKLKSWHCHANYSKQQKEISQEYNKLCSSRQERDRLNGDWGEE